MQRSFFVAMVAALVAALLPLAAISAIAQEAGPQPQIRPQEADDTAVRPGKRISITGPANGERINSAALLGLGPDGAVTFEQPITEINRGPAEQAPEQNYLRIVAGQFEGQATLGCGFARPAVRCTNQYPGAVGEITGVALRVVVDGAQGTSNTVRNDYTDPFIVRYELVGTDRIKVLFSEPVRAQDGDQPLEWTVDGLRPAAVEDPRDPTCTYPEPEMTTGCTRILRVTPKDEDAEPLVSYQPDRIGRLFAVYRDYADNSLAVVPQETSNALDRIRPSKPTIDTVNGRPASGGQVKDNERTPTVRVSNVRAGHRVTVTATGPGGTREATVLVPAGATTVDVPLPALATGPEQDGSYVLHAVAIDVHDNRSDDTSMAPSTTRPDGGPDTVTYVLDTIAPLPLSARETAARQVAVSFTEPIVPAGQAGEWRVGDQTVTAQGEGDERQLAADADVEPGEPVRWAPTDTRYEDEAGNPLAAFELPLLALPQLPAPTVTTPANELYTRASRVVIEGTAPTTPGLVVDLYERNSDTVLQSTDVQQGSWRFEQDLVEDARYQFEVRLREDASGARSPRTPVPDIVRDTVVPTVEVTQPSPAPPTEELDGRRRYGVGDGVTVEWTASDPATGDTVRTDHGSTVDVILRFTDGNERVIATGLPHAPGQPRTYTHTLTAEDLAGLGQREAVFRVRVNDLAGNAGSDDSAPFLILGSILGWEPYLVEPTIIEARFAVPLTGTTTPGEWFVDGRPAQFVSKVERDGVTVIRLTDTMTNDVNATPQVEYRPAALNLNPLRGPGNTEVSTILKTTRDAILPTLELDTAGPGRPIDADTIDLSGSTDASSRPNTVAAYRTDPAGAATGDPIQTVTASEDGDWAMSVPLTPNATNHLVVQAIDPAGNLSSRLPQPPFTVIEDSLAPVVAILEPANDSLVNPVVAIRWQTTEANPDSVDLDYRIAGEQWREIAHGTADDGAHDWELPDNARNAIFEIRVTAVDQTDKAGTATVGGLRLDFVAPVITKARATGAQVLEVTFDEPVTLDGSGFDVDGSGIRSVKGTGTTHTLILDRSMQSTTPQVSYSGSQVRDVAGNAMEPLEITARRSFAFAVKNLQGQRLGRNRIRLAFTDVRNRAHDLRGYRIYRDGERIRQLQPDARSFTDREAAGRHRYTVRAVDDRRRLSSVRRVVIRR